MADIEIILTSPTSTIRSLTVPPRRLSVPTALRSSGRSESKQQVRKSSLATVSQQDSRPLSYHLYTLFLFTCRDFITIVFPQTLLGVVSALASHWSSASISTSNLAIFSHLPQALLWVWVHLLVCDIANQTHKDSIVEDKANKPWRPIPSCRITRDEARTFLFTVVIPFGLALSVYFGTLGACLSLLLNCSFYNHFLINSDPITRNLMNAGGYTSFGLGAAQILARGTTTAQLSRHTYIWFAILFAVIFTTVQVQDLEDEEGDRKSERRTLPILIGRTWTIASIVVAMMLITVLAPRYWNASFRSSMAFFAIGAWVVKGLVTAEDKSADRLNYKKYMGWIMALYLLPLFAQ